jgi:ParB family transcriptional regulator, chromosome partitioning protein
MSLSPSTTDNARQNTMQELRELPLDVIVPDPSQPRRHFGEEALMGLAGSMGERGVLQPVLVRPLQDGMYQLVAGERRWRAAKLADLQSIPALVSRYDDAAALEVALIENLARKDLNPVEQARAFATLSNEFGLTHRQIGKRVGRHETVVSSYVRLLRLSEEILELLERGTLSEGHGRALLRAKDPQARSQLARAAVQEGWTVQRIEARASASNVDLLASQQDRSEQVQDPNDQAQDRSEQAQDPEQAQDLAALSLARSWGDLLGAEVHVRPMSRRQLRMEVEFDFASEGLALADRLVAAISR